MAPIQPYEENPQAPTPQSIQEMPFSPPRILISGQDRIPDYFTREPTYFPLSRQGNIDHVPNPEFLVKSDEITGSPLYGAF